MSGETQPPLPKHVLNPHRYKLQNIAYSFPQRPERVLARMLLEWHPDMHIGAAVGTAYAMHYVQKVMGADTSNALVAAMMFGGCARGLKNDRLPKDIDILLVWKDGSQTPTVKAHRRINVLTYRESAFEHPSLELADPESAFKRRILALPHVPLHGRVYLKKLGQIARKNLKVSDFDYFVEAQVKKLEKEYEKNNTPVPPLNELRKQVAERLELTEAIKNILVGNID